MHVTLDPMYVVTHSSFEQTINVARLIFIIMTIFQSPHSQYYLPNPLS